MGVGADRRYSSLPKTSSAPPRLCSKPPAAPDGEMGAGEVTFPGRLGAAATAEATGRGTVVKACQLSSCLSPRLRIGYALAGAVINSQTQEVPQ